jgi:hypothetical protein
MIFKESAFKYEEFCLLGNNALLSGEWAPITICTLTLQRGDLNSAAVSVLRYFFQPGI